MEEQIAYVIFINRTISFFRAQFYLRPQSINRLISIHHSSTGFRTLNQQITVKIHSIDSFKTRNLRVREAHKIDEKYEWN